MSAEIRLPKAISGEKKQMSFVVKAKLTGAQWSELTERLKALQPHFPSLTFKVTRPKR